MLTAVMAVSAAPVTGSVVDVFGGSAITASAATSKRPGVEYITDEDGLEYAVHSSSFEYDEKLQKYKVPCCLVENGNISVYVCLGRVYVTDNPTSSKITGSFVDDDSYKAYGDFQGVVGDHSG